VQHVLLVHLLLAPEVMVKALLLALEVMAVGICLYDTIFQLLLLRLRMQL
jgi:hypothetical protein